MPRERAALEAAVRAGLVPEGLAREAVERHAALARAGQQANLLGLAAERLDPRAREALARFVRGARDTASGSTVPGGPPRGTSPSSSAGGEPRGPSSLPGPGDRVAGYTIERELGRGGMGAVFAAVSSTGQRVALKLLLGGAGDAQQAERFLREANAARKLQHPAIVGLHDAGVDERGRQFMAMQFVDGESLRDRLERKGPLPSREAARIALELTRALEHAHAQFVLHRDLKPHNVLLARDGSILLADFGLARNAQDTRLTSTGELLGTPAYMAPEQAAGERGSVDARSDVYGLGATLYHALAGAPPFEGPTLVNIITSVLTRPPAPPSTRADGVDPVLEELCLRCLHKSPADRFQSASALGHELARWLESTSGPAPRRGRAPLAVAAVAVAVAAAGGAYALASRGAPPPVDVTEVEGPVAHVTTTTSVTPPPTSTTSTTEPAPPPEVDEGELISPLPTTTTSTGRDLLRIDASTFRDLRSLELRAPWLIDPTRDGIWLRGAGEEGTRTGLCLQLLFPRPAAFEVSVDLTLARLEPALPLGIVWKQGARHVASLGLVPQWTRTGDAAVMEHRLTLLYQSPEAGVPALTCAGAPVALRPGPQDMVLRLRYELDPPRLEGSIKGGQLETITLPLPNLLPPDAAYLSLWLQQAEVHRPETAAFWDTESSEVLVRSLQLEVDAGAAQARAGGWAAARYGWLGRRSSDERELPAVLAQLDDTAELAALKGAAAEALFMGAMRCAGSDAHAGRAVEYLQRAALAAGGDQVLWAARRHDVFALGPRQRSALCNWLRTWKTGDLAVQGLDIVNRRGGRNAPDRDWWLAATVLSASVADTHPAETGEALSMVGDFAGARQLLRDAESGLRVRLREATGADARKLGDELRGILRSRAFTAYRLRDFEEAQRLWRENTPERNQRGQVYRGLPAHLRQ